MKILNQKRKKRRIKEIGEGFHRCGCRSMTRKNEISLNQVAGNQGARVTGGQDTRVTGYQGAMVLVGGAKTEYLTYLTVFYWLHAMVMSVEPVLSTIRKVRAIHTTSGRAHYID